MTVLFEGDKTIQAVTALLIIFGQLIRSKKFGENIYYVNITNKKLNTFVIIGFKII